jgi:hypothetical protein
VHVLKHARHRISTRMKLGLPAQTDTHN